MCGITGIAGYKGDPIKDIEAMNARIIHRGPDAGGHYLDENRHVVIGHRRLSIIDLSEAGAQPMTSHSGRYVMAYNGEIYNAPDIKKELTGQYGDLTFKGTSDTEILLEAIERFGIEKTLKKCRGMWGISLYDRETGRICLSRDRMGEKPLYFGRIQGQFVWASDINSIKAIHGFDAPIDNVVLAVYLRYGYIPAPYSIYKGIYKLKPGTILTIDPPYSKWEESAYYDIREVALNGQSHPFDGSEKEAADELEKRLKNALKGQMISDVPLGAFLSGGIDSTLVVSLMQSISPVPVKTFTIGFNEEGFNEASFAKENAAILGTEHTEMYVGYKDVMDLLPNLSKAYGEPFADSSQLPTMLVSAMTKKHVTVALSGDAGDEFFCGYNTYRNAHEGYAVSTGKLGFLKGPARDAAGKVAGALDKITISSAGSISDNIHKLNTVLNIRTYTDYYRAMNLDPNAIRLIRGGYSPVSVSNDAYTDGYMPDHESDLMLMDMLQYLPDDILVKVDRAGMFYSLETRIPLLDADVIDLAWSLPLTYKYKDGITKRPLRDILYRYIPKENMDRPKKGFSVPVSEWLKQGEMRQWAESVISDSRQVAGEYIDVRLWDDIWQKYIETGTWSGLIWYVLMFESWLMSE